MGEAENKSARGDVVCPSPSPTPSPPSRELTEAEQKYREFLLQCDVQVLGSYAKTMLTLAGGALAISLTVLKDFLGERSLSGFGFLLAAWSCWGGSLFLTLGAYYTSHLALRAAVTRLDQGLDPQRNSWNHVTKAMNPASGGIFLAACCLFYLFRST